MRVNLNIFLFDEESLKSTARQWIDCGIAINLDDELIELNEQFFEHIQISKSFGDFLKRESLNTYIGICDDDCDSPNIIIEVGYHRTDYSQAFLQQMHEAAVVMKSELDSAGLSVEFEGKRWLAFRRK